MHRRATVVFAASVHEGSPTLVDRLDLERIDRDLFRGFSPDHGLPRVFGGSVAAQALVAAVRTTDGSRPVHSLHAYFLRPGNPQLPIIYDVDRIRDGFSFTTRRVVAVQDGEAIFNMSASFQTNEPGHDHHRPMPPVPPPESIPSNQERRQRSDHPELHRFHALMDRFEWPIEHREPDPMDVAAPEPKPGPRQVWFRSEEPLPDDPLFHQCVLAYASDFGLLQSSLRQHGLTFMTPNLKVASLDHAAWFHRPFRADEWLLYDLWSPSASGARGLNFGHVYRQDGTLVASFAQEGLMRVRDRSDPSP